MNERYFKKVYSHCDFYRALVAVVRSLQYLKLNRPTKLVSPLFQERIMLAVTEVNGCAACSFAHTRFALEEGMTTEEINALLSGDTGNIPEGEIIGVMFAQHYADQKGKVSQEAWQRLVDEYGVDKAHVILAFIRMITVGNIYGMAISALADRFRGKHTGKTSLLYEISIILSVLLYAPVAIIHGLIDNLRKKSIYPF